MAKIKPYFMENKWARGALILIDVALALFLAPFTRKNGPLPNPKRILLSQPAHIGDVILTTALLRPIKTLFPEIQIGIVVGSHSKMVIENHPDITWIHIVDHFKLNRTTLPWIKKALTYLRTRKKALKELREVKYDLVIDCPFHYPNLSSLFWRAKIPHRVGFKQAGFSAFLTHVQSWENHNISAAYHFFSLLKQIPAFKNWKEPLKPSLADPTPLTVPKEYIVIHMSSGNPMKNWPEHHWKELIDALALRGETLIFTGKGAQEKNPSLIKEGMIDLIDKLSWSQFLSVIKQAKALFAVDTSAGHIAAAFDTPSYLLYTSIYPSKLWTPLSDKAHIFTHPTPCSPCFRGKGCPSMTCLREVKPQSLINCWEKNLMLKSSTMKKVLITGGAGYVGTRLTNQLLKKGYRVVVYDTLFFGCKLDNHPGLTIVEGDIRDTEKFRLAVRGCDVVIHLACISNDPCFELDDGLSTTINYECFEPLVIAAKEEKVKRFIHASTSSVYGVSSAPNVTEDHPLLPITHYNKFKGLCEKILLKHQSKEFVCVNIRPATICGYSPRMRFDLSVNILTNHAINNGKITLFGGEQLRPNLHIQDMCDLYEFLLEVPDEKIAGETFNFGFQNLSLANIALIVKKIVEQEFPEKKEIAIVRTESQDIRSYHISSAKIAQKLSFAPKKTIEDAVRELCQSFKKDLFPDSMNDPSYYNVKTLKAKGIS